MGRFLQNMAEGGGNHPRTYTRAPLRWIGALLGWLGALNSFAIGLYIVTTYLEIARFSRKTARDLLYSVYVSAFLTVAFTFVLVYGSYLIWRDNARKGGLLNVITGGSLIPIFIYFAFFSKPTLIQWLGLNGAFLCTPAILSGTIGIVISR